MINNNMPDYSMPDYSNTRVLNVPKSQRAAFNETLRSKEHNPLSVNRDTPPVSLIHKSRQAELYNFFGEEIYNKYLQNRLEIKKEGRVRRERELELLKKFLSANNVDIEAFLRLVKGFEPRIANMPEIQSGLSREESAVEPLSATFRAPYDGGTTGWDIRYEGMVCYTSHQDDWHTGRASAMAYSRIPEFGEADNNDHCNMYGSTWLYSWYQMPVTAPLNVIMHVRCVKADARGVLINEPWWSWGSAISGVALTSFVWASPSRKSTQKNSWFFVESRHLTEQERVSLDHSPIPPNSYWKAEFNTDIAFNAGEWVAVMVGTEVYNSQQLDDVKGVLGVTADFDSIWVEVRP
jgi:hypothetical protein